MTDTKVPRIHRDDGAMPVLGLGTWQNDGVIGGRAVRTAIELGYRHIDTAQMYDNEDMVGQAIVETDIERDVLFVTTKVAPGNMDERSVRESCAKSLERLRTDYVDLLLIHWPDDSIPLAETLGAMADLRAKGQVKHIGVSNFSVDLMKEAIHAADFPIFCNQVEYHPYLAQDAVLSFCRKEGIALVAYCPLAQGAVVKDERLYDIGKRHDKSAAQVALRWLIRQRGVAAIPKATRPEHLEENFGVFDFDLTDAEQDAIDAFEKDRRLINPGWAPEWDNAAA